MRSRAAIISTTDGLDAIEIVDREPPEPGEGEVRVRIRMAGANPIDAGIAAGRMPNLKEMPLVLGCVGAGEVETDGASFRAGDRVAVVGNTAGRAVDGTWADHATLSEDLLLALPDEVDFISAAALGIALPTAALAVERCGAEAGGTVLVLGASGGVGSAAVQLARAAGLRVVAASRTSGGCVVAATVGADETIDLSARSLQEASRELTKRGFDAIIDPVGGAMTAEALRTLAPKSTHVVVGYVAGVETSMLLPDLVSMGRRLEGCNMLIAGAKGLRKAEEECLAALASGDLRVPVAATFGLDAITRAYAAIADPAVHGRVLIEP